MRTKGPCCVLSSYCIIQNSSQQNEEEFCAIYQTFLILEEYKNNQIRVQHFLSVSCDWRKVFPMLERSLGLRKVPDWTVQLSIILVFAYRLRDFSYFINAVLLKAGRLSYPANMNMNMKEKS